MQVAIGFGKSTVSLDIPQNHPTQVLVPNEVALGLTGVDEVRRALENPIDSPRIGEIVKPAKRSRL